jgi:hypothetical protein
MHNFCFGTMMTMTTTSGTSREAIARSDGQKQPNQSVRSEHTTPHVNVGRFCYLNL